MRTLQKNELKTDLLEAFLHYFSMEEAKSLLDFLSNLCR